ncbi:uncharacterized protein PV09_02455 [Verruconis gallopava]|uniref:F-box domain-containing protein n=1 Tax=Verruconis gallopava TaxID=253628 RepID=A0A0D1Z1E7_9PEZI|nr:uncharacterized protein PV09_02455 [Verruconis gallopava]KIW06767.1 hypothetical protein PV09_02455 [Verruconis gallopava]
MGQFLELPAEIRQEILLSALPEKITVSPAEVHPMTRLLLICKVVKQDVEEIAKKFSPEYLVVEPSHLCCLKSRRPAMSPIECVTLEIFSAATLEAMTGATSSSVSSSEIGDLLYQWNFALGAARSAFPKSGLKQITVDLTPIPHSCRDESDYSITMAVSHPAVANRMFSMCESQISNLIIFICTYLKITAQRQRPKLLVTGKLSLQTLFRIPTLLQDIARIREEGIEIRFDPEWMDESKV